MKEDKRYPLAIYFDSYCKILDYDSQEWRDVAIESLDNAITKKTICRLQNFVFCGDKVNFYEIKEPF